MNTVFNIVMILLVALITYWWANQGLFSALLHLLCVTLAGAIALAFWEPLTTGVLLRNTWFDNYAWGVTLVVLFVLSLFIFRVLFDRLVPLNVRMPQWANLLFGSMAGAGAGVLTIGILIIGCGFIQSSSDVMGFRDYGRNVQTGEVGVNKSGAMWAPFHTWTYNFYSYLSVTSFRNYGTYPGSLRRYNPSLDKQASLVRDSAVGGKGQVSLQPSEAIIEAVYHCGNSNRYAVKVRFENGARDHGQQFTLSSSQIRLIEYVTGVNEPRTVHPDSWTQYSGYHRFDDMSHYVTSGPAQDYAEAAFEFQVPVGFTPKFVQIRGTRYPLDNMLARADVENCSEFGGGASMGGAQVEVDFNLAARIPGSDIEISNSIRPINISTNLLPGSIEHADKYLTTGTLIWSRGGPRSSRTLSIKGIYEPAGTKCVQLDVSRRKTCDIFSISGDVAQGATLALVDSNGNEYAPIGYMYNRGEEVELKLDPANFMRTIDKLPRIPTSGGPTLKLFFYVADDATLIGFRYGDRPLGKCSVVMNAPTR